MNDASAAFMRFDHANDAATLLASEDTHAAMTALNAYVNDLLKMPPYAPSNDPDAEIPNSTRDITLGARDITAKFIEKAAKDIGGNAPNRTALSLDIPPNGEPSVTP